MRLAKATTKAPLGLLNRVSSVRAMTNGKTANRIHVLDVIRTHPRVSRADLARITGLSQPTILDIVEPLMEKGLVRELGPARIPRGRRPIQLEINPDYGYVIGIVLDDSLVMTSALCDFRGRILHITRKKLPEISEGAIVQLAVSSVERLLAKAGVARDQFLAVGFVSPGIISPETGFIAYSAHLALKEVPIRHLLESAIGRPVYLENRPNAAAYLELVHGQGREHDNFLYVFAGQTMGASLVVDGGLYRGKWGAAGEIGHITIDVKGPVCRCGNRGCAEALYREALWAALRATLPPARTAGKDWELYSQQLQRVSRKAPEALRDAYQWLAIAIANLVNTHDPGAVVLNGEVIPGSPAVFEALVHFIRERILVPARDRVVIVRSQLEDAPILGVVLRALHGIEEELVMSF